jgi:hypothetical protein
VNSLGRDGYEPHSVKEFKGIIDGQKIIIEDKEYTVYRNDDRANKITLISRHSGFGYIDIDKLLEIMDKDEESEN